MRVVGGAAECTTIVGVVGVREGEGAERAAEVGVVGGGMEGDDNDCAGCRTAGPFGATLAVPVGFSSLVSSFSSFMVSVMVVEAMARQVAVQPQK